MGGRGISGSIVPNEPPSLILLPSSSILPAASRESIFPVTTTIHITNHQKTLAVNRRHIRRAVQTIVHDAGISEARISIAIVDAPTIAALHGRFLGDPEPTDVLSFVLDQSQRSLEGEVVVSADAALARAPEYLATPDDELLLYVIHGTLHLVGFDDTTPRKPAESCERRSRSTWPAGAHLQHLPAPASGRDAGAEGNTGFRVQDGRFKAEGSRPKVQGSEPRSLKSPNPQIPRSLRLRAGLLLDALDVAAAEGFHFAA